MEMAREPRIRGEMRQVVEIRCYEDLFTKVVNLGFPSGLVATDLPCSAGGTGSTPGPGRCHELRGS